MCEKPLEKFFDAREQAALRKATGGLVGGKALHTLGAIELFELTRTHAYYVAIHDPAPATLTA